MELLWERAGEKAGEGAGWGMQRVLLALLKSSLKEVFSSLSAQGEWCFCRAEVRVELAGTKRLVWGRK